MTLPNPFPYTAPDLVDMLDLDPLASETTSDLQNLAQDCYHWLLCRPGSNPDDPTRGIGVELYLSGTANDLMGLQTAIEADFDKDVRIAATLATVILNPDGSYTIAVKVRGATGLVFSLSYSYTQAGGLVPFS